MHTFVFDRLQKQQKNLQSAAQYLWDAARLFACIVRVLPVPDARGSNAGFSSAHCWLIFGNGHAATQADSQK